MTLRDSIQPSVISSSCACTRSQRSFFELSVGSCTSWNSRISTTSPRVTSSKSAATTAVELRIWARRATITPVLFLFARVLQPATQLNDIEIRRTLKADFVMWIFITAVLNSLLRSLQTNTNLDSQVDQTILLACGMLIWPRPHPA